MPQDAAHSLDMIFKPAAVAVVGASSNPEKTGHVILKNIIDGGYKGRIYPVNPSGGEILGLSAYPSLTEVPGTVDLVVVVVPAKFVPEAMAQAGAKGVKGAVVITGGFREIGRDDLERQIMEIAAAHGIRVIGPNCQGINYTASELCASWPLLTCRGGMAVISQSGTVGAAMGEWAQDEGIGISAFVSPGNKADLNELDLIEYFSRDPRTKVISLYLEGTSDGRRFMAVCRDAVGRTPMVVLRPGRTEQGRRAAESHTRSMGGNHLIFDAACKQVGVLKAETVEDLYDFSKLLMLRPDGYPNAGGPLRLAILTSSGGSGIIAIDVAQEHRIQVPDLEDGARERLRAVLPTHCVLRNPLDLTGDATAERYETAVLELAQAQEFELFFLIFGDPIPRAGEVVVRLRTRLRELPKPPGIVVCYFGGGRVGKEETAELLRGRVPVYPTPERAVRAIAGTVGR